MEALDLITSLETSNESLGRLLLVAWIYHPVPHIGREPGEGYTRLSAEERLAETWRRLLARNKLPV